MGDKEDEAAWLRRRINRLTEVRQLVNDERTGRAIDERIAEVRSQLERLERKGRRRPPGGSRN